MATLKHDGPSALRHSETGEMVKTIDMTPTWLGILPGLLAVIANGETVEARKAAEQELRRMANLADRYVETMATRVPVRRFGGDDVPAREAAALAEQRAIDGPKPGFCECGKPLGHA